MTAFPDEKSDKSRFHLRKLSLCLTMPNAMKTYLLLNWASRHADVLEWRYSSTHS